MTEIQNLTQYLESIGKDKAREALISVTKAMKEMNQAIANYQKAQAEFTTAVAEIFQQKPKAGPVISEEPVMSVEPSGYTGRDVSHSTVQSAPGSHLPVVEIGKDTFDPRNIPSEAPDMETFPDPEVIESIATVDEPYRIFRKFEKVCIDFKGLEDSEHDVVFNEVMRAIPPRERIYNRHSDIWMVKEQHAKKMISIGRKYGLRVAPKV